MTLKGAVCCEAVRSAILATAWLLVIFITRTHVKLRDTATAILCVRQFEYDTIGESNVDSKAEYSALYSTR